ncbi:MAG: MaoC/PaaZ C-terminal domain-containing protein [Desulfobacterales bacterium]|nr:MaoC/PaaZ C-terminal domain-containing protein [Desulfobacterales bacterium]
MVNPIRQRAIDGLQPGDTFTIERTFTRAETNAFGDITRDYNPVHYDSRWAEGKGFNDLICHGLLVGSMICEFGGQVGWLATGMNFKFFRPVYFGDTITCSIVITKIAASGRAEAKALFSNNAGDQVGQVHMTGRLPLDSDRDLLKQMIFEGDPTNKLNDDAA